MKEETGLVGEVDMFIDYKPNPSPLYEMVISFGFLMRVVGGKLQAGDDAVEARFVALDNLPEICFASHRYFIEEAKKKYFNQ